MKVIYILFIFTSLNVFAQVLCTTGLDSFEKNIYPSLKAKCINCHSEDNLAPPHAHKDVEKAYQTALESVKFPNYENSKFVAKAKDKHWLEYDPDEVGISVEEIKKHLNAWYVNGQNDCPDEIKFVSNAIKMPEDLPSIKDNKFRTFRWKITNDGQFFSDTFIEAKVQVFTYKEGNIPKSYRIKDVRIASLDHIQVKGIQVVVNNQVDPDENSYLFIEKPIVAANFDLDTEVWPIPMVSLKNEIVTDRGQKEHALAFSFKEIKKIEMDNSKCRNEEKFEKFMQKEFNANKCLSCHSDSTKTASQRINLSLSINDDCIAFQKRMNFDNLRNSQVYKFIFNGHNGHPRINSFRRKIFLNSVNLWLESK
jgi:hypothetical protein